MKITWAIAEAMYPGCSAAWDRDCLDLTIDKLLHEHVSRSDQRLVACLFEGHRTIYHREHPDGGPPIECKRWCIRHMRWERVYADLKNGLGTVPNECGWP